MESIKVYISEIEIIRDQIILFAHENDIPSLTKSLQNALDLINVDLSENDQKALNQIVHCVNYFRKYKNSLVDDRLTFLKKEISSKLKSIVKEQIKRACTIDFDSWLSKDGLSDIQLQRVIENLSSLQITTGCSNFCRRCNEWALFHPRMHFDFEAVKKFLGLLSKASNMDFNLYCASDPLDWKSEDKDIVDIERLFKEMGIRPNFGILTKVPRGREKILEKLLDEDADIGVSITRRNRRRVDDLLKKYNHNTFKQHELDELTIEAGLDEDFSSIKPSITDSYGIEITADGVFQIIPTFTSALCLTGQSRIPVTNKSFLFIKQMTGREALSVPYFKPLTFINIEGNEVTLPDLIEPQVENIILDRSKEDADPPGMMNLKEFFRSFDREAVLVRRRICSKVLEGAVSKFENSEHFEKYKKYYLKSCEIEACSEMKIDAAVFLLKEVKGYILKNPVRAGIAKFLRGNDLNNISERFKEQFRDGIEKTLYKESEDSFFTFETLLLSILNNNEKSRIEEFLNKRDVVYDRITGFFIKKD